MRAKHGVRVDKQNGEQTSPVLYKADIVLGQRAGEVRVTACAAYARIEECLRLFLEWDRDRDSQAQPAAVFDEEFCT